MIGKIYTIALSGISGEVVEVQSNITRGLPKFNIVGLPDISIDEARARVKSAITVMGAEFPYSAVTINLAPAAVKKSGTSFDLPIALSILQATRQAVPVDFQDCIVLGELGLDGAVKYVPGLLPMVRSGLEAGFTRFIIPAAGLPEVRFLDGARFLPIESIRQCMDSSLFAAIEEVQGDKRLFTPETHITSDNTFADIYGHESAKRALSIAMAGRHNILLSGPPGSGKTVLSKAARFLLPPLTLDEALETSMLYSISGLLKNSLITERPFRHPHHASSHVSLIGGGSYPRPGEISLAHHGILFLDEIAEFQKHTLEVLRQPLEDKQITISRAKYSVTYPANFILIGAMNPCPCGYLTDSTKLCTCSITQLKQYRKRLSGPLMDRIDICIEVPKLRFENLSVAASKEDYVRVKNQVQTVHTLQHSRYHSTTKYNGDLSSREVKTYCVCDNAALEILKMAVEKLSLTGRSYFKVLKIARTIADFDTSVHIRFPHIQEALQYREHIVTT